MNALGERLLPYIVTALFAAIGWGVTHTVDRLGKSPVIQYETELNASGRDRSLVVTLRNPSDNRLYKNLSLIFILPGNDGGTILGVRTIPKPPAWEGSEQPIATPGSATFTLSELHPGWEIALAVRFSGEVVPIFHLQRAEPTARLLAPSFELFLINHGFKIIFGALLVWAGTLAWLIGRQRSKKKPKRVAEATK